MDAAISREGLPGRREACPRPGWTRPTRPRGLTLVALAAVALAAALLLGGAGTTSPDLTVLLAARPLRPAPGETVTLTATVTNRGDAPAEASHLQVWVDDEAPPRDFAVPDLEPGQSRTFDDRESFLKPGRHRIRAVADAQNEVRERDETNNSQSVWIEVEMGAPLDAGR